MTEQGVYVPLSCSVSTSFILENAVILASSSCVPVTCLPDQIGSPCSITPIYPPHAPWRQQTREGMDADKQQKKEKGDVFKAFTFTKIPTKLHHDRFLFPRSAVYNSNRQIYPLWMSSAVKIDAAETHEPTPSHSVGDLDDSIRRSDEWLQTKAGLYERLHPPSLTGVVSVRTPRLCRRSSVCFSEAPAPILSLLSAQLFWFHITVSSRY